MTSAIVTYCILGCVFVLLLCVAPIHGGCLADGDTSHVAADWSQRLWEYSSKAPVQPSSSADLKFLTFNIQSGYFLNCVNNVTAQALLMRTADYTGNQEAVQGVDTRCGSCKVGQVVADVAGFSTRFVMAMPYRTGQYGTNVGTSQEIKETKYIVMNNNVGREPRVAVALRTSPPVFKGRSLWYVNIHIEYYDGNLRLQQANQVIDFIQSDILATDSTATIVIGGDFNGGPWDAVYGAMKAAGYKNTWEVFHGSIADGNTIPADWPGSRFDHIWYKAPSDVYVTVKDAYVPDVRMSDHRPYACTLNFVVSPSTQATTKPIPATSAPIPPTSAPTEAPKAPTEAPKAPTAAPVAPTSAPVAATSAPNAPNGAPVSDGDCVAVPGRGVTDQWCRDVKCDAAYVPGYCQRTGATAATKAPVPPTSAPTTPNSQILCVGPIAQDTPVTITCPNPAHKMTTVQYANYGTNSGTCGNLVRGNCIGGSSTAVVKDKCVGRNTCTFPVANNVFGDPCPERSKTFYTQVVCSV